MVALLRHQPTRRLPVARDGVAARPELRLVRGGVAARSHGCSPGWSGAAPGRELDGVGARDVGGPALRLVPGGDAPARPGLGVIAAVALVVFGLLALLRVVQAPAATASIGADPSPDASFVVGPDDRVVIAGPGDTLWSIGSELSPGSDPRPVVVALIEANGGDSLQIGQQIVIPGHLLD